MYLNNFKKNGFTLMELMIYLMIMGLFFSFTTPTALKLLQHSQQQVIVDTLGNAIRQARLQAMVTGDTWILAPLSEDNDWSKGIGLYAFDKGKKMANEPRYQWVWGFEKVSIIWRGFQSKNALYFTQDPGSSAVNGTFLIRVAKEPLLKVMVNRLGYMH